MISIDAKDVHLKRVHGDFIALYTYVNDERAMILFPSKRLGANGRPPPWAIIADSAAWKYSDDFYLMRQAMEFCKLWDMPERSAAVKVATIINEGLPDLLRIPPQRVPESRGTVIGEADLLVDGKKLTTTEVSIPEGIDSEQYGPADKSEYH